MFVNELGWIIVKMNKILLKFSEKTPGPGTYSPALNPVTKHFPAFSLGKASREGLEPLLGPYSSN